MSLSLREQLAPFARGTQKACLRKRQYVTRRYAEHVAQLRLNDVRDAPKMLYAYRCTHCGYWHLTQMDPHT